MTSRRQGKAFPCSIRKVPLRNIPTLIVSPRSSEGKLYNGMCGHPNIPPHITTPQPTPALSPLQTHLGTLPSPLPQGFLHSHVCAAELGEWKEMQPLIVLLQVHLFISVIFFQCYGCPSPSSSMVRPPHPAQPSRNVHHHHAQRADRQISVKTSFFLLITTPRSMNELLVQVSCMPLPRPLPPCDPAVWDRI